MRMLGLDRPAATPSAVALGLFDGVHIGHQAVLQAAVAHGKKLGAMPCAFTFAADSVPVKQGVAMEYLYTDAQKLALLAECGIAAVYAPPFQALRDLDGEHFCRRVLVEVFQARDVFCGADFRFGARAAWDVDDLMAFGGYLGFGVHQIPPVCAGGEIVSSTRIRRMLQTGLPEQAAQLLGAPYQILGQVVHGEARGRRHAVPTINLPFAKGQLVPAYGVYVSRTRTPQGCFDSITDIGVKPTVSDSAAPAAETFLLDFSGDLYDQPCTVELLHFLRAEQKFPDEAALYRQIQRDQQQCRSWLAEYRQTQTAVD